MTRQPESDRPLPEQAVSKPRIEIARQPLSAETQRLIEHLGRNGYAIHNLAGKTLTTLENEGMPFWKKSHDLDHVSAPPGLVAFKQNPSDFFLRGSLNTPYEKQLDLLEEEKTKVEREYPDAGLIVRVGKPSEWAEAAFEHFKGTNVRIFGTDYGLTPTWADAYHSRYNSRAYVGFWNAATYRGLEIDFQSSDYAGSLMGLAPLVEIPRG
jgi:hypothetical protein